MSSFDKWLARYCEVNIIPEGELQGIALSCENEKIYGKDNWYIDSSICGWDYHAVV